MVGAGFVALAAALLIEVPLVLRGTGSAESRGVIRLGYLTGSRKHPDGPFYNKPGETISGAMTFATTEVNEDPTILPNHTLEFIIAETYGQEPDSIRQTVLMMQRSISAFIGPQETCVHEARIAAAFNRPMISYVSISPLSSMSKCFMPCYLLNSSHLISFLFM